MKPKLRAQEESFGQIVRRYRVAQHRTQADVAQAIGTSTPFVSAVENGRYKSAAPATVVKWADFLGIPRSALLRLGAPKRVKDWQTAIAESDGQPRARKAP
jgi:transcriptional regulator with XRE-family HTH domain